MLISATFHRYKGFLFELTAKGISSSFEKGLEGTGFSTFFKKNSKKEVFIATADNSESNLNEFFSVIMEDNSIDEIKKQLCSLDGVFQFVIHDKSNKCTYFGCDRIGVGKFYFKEEVNRQSLFLLSSLHLYPSSLNIDNEGLIFQLAFGYHVKPHPFIYKDIFSTDGGTLYRYNHTNGNIDEDKYWEGSIDSSIVDYSKIFSDSVNHGTHLNNLSLGLTAGKDSLAILSCFKKKGRGYSLGSLDSADVCQGKKIADFLQMPWKHIQLCNRNELLENLRHISRYSGGLATGSYVDMVEMFKHTDLNSGFIMGEGGECVRDFFKLNSDINDFKIFHNYLTPFKILSNYLINFPFYTEEEYFNACFAPVLKQSNVNSLDEFSSYFYRNCRMPGNFSLRHQILAPLRDKISPFLNGKFIDATYTLPLNSFKNSAIHREVIMMFNDKLLPFFDFPLKSNISTQNWSERLQGDLLKEILEIVSLNVKEFDGLIKERSVNDLISSSSKEERLYYFLLRIVSLKMFLSKSNQ